MACASVVTVSLGAFVGVLLANMVPTATSNDVTWGVDATHELPASRFVRMHNTVCTKEPFRFGGNTSDFATLPPAPHIGPATTDDAQNNVSLNAYVGAAHAYCFALKVAGVRDAFSFRIGTSAEINALTAIVHLPAKSLVLTYASSDGDDFELGQARTTIRYRHPSESYVNGAATYSYDQAAATADGQPTAPPPPPPNPSPPKPEPLKMQSFMGSDMETAYDELRVHKDTLAYCCSGVYTQMDSEGAS